MSAMPTNEARLLSHTSAKAIKAGEFGYRNAILYMAPAEFANVGNLCPHASPACRAACLGLYSGQASMVKSDALKHANNVRLSRIAKARAFMQSRVEFMALLARSIAWNYAAATRDGLTLCVRLNGSTDIAFEGVRVTVSENDARYISARLGRAVLPGSYRNVFELFPTIQFVDYTKNPRRMVLYTLPSNYHLTFSRSETNQTHMLALLAQQKNVAVVFDALPETYMGARVVNGDENDLRHLDPKAEWPALGYVIGLLPKGSKAKRDQSGFVVR